MYILTAEQERLKNELIQFTDEEICPIASKLDKSHTFPKNLISLMGERGYLDAMFISKRPTALHNAFSGVMIIEAISRGLASLGIIVGPNYQCCDLLWEFGCDRIRHEILESALKGEKVLAFALSEPAGGSNALGIETTAISDGNHWILNGTKSWITGAGNVDGYVVAAKSSAFSRSRSVSLFYVDNNSKGLLINESKNMLGMHSSPMANIEFNDCEIPLDCILGPKDNAYPLIKAILNVGRLAMSAIAIGIAQAALEASIDYTSIIGRYGRSLSTYQGVTFMVVDMYTKIAAARNSLYHVASLFDAKKPHSAEVAALKLFATEMCCDVCKNARQIHGANGLCDDHNIERYFRDSQMLTVAEGTSEICKVVMANNLYQTTKKKFYK